MSAMPQESREALVTRLDAEQQKLRIAAIECYYDGKPAAGARALPMLVRATEIEGEIYDLGSRPTKPETRPPERIPYVPLSVCTETTQEIRAREQREYQHKTKQEKALGQLTFF